MHSGGCHCGAIRYEASGDPMYHALCHCSDCRRSAGAPMVGWAMYSKESVKISGEPSTYASSEHGRRLFCIQCGTGLFYTNEQNLPGIIDIQSGTLDEPDDLPGQGHIQTADRIKWMEHVHELPQYEGFPPQE